MKIVFRIEGIVGKDEPKAALEVVASDDGLVFTIGDRTIVVDPDEVKEMLEIMDDSSII
jgi:hypothetical protein